VSSALELTFLEDGGQTADQIAGQLADYIGAAQKSLDIAIYDLNLSGGPADQLQTAIKGVAARGVAVRIVYNVDYPGPIPVPPPSQADPAYIESMGVPHRAVSGIPELMHHKYIVRDVGAEQAGVWTGSANWTNDSWNREENVILRLPSPDLARLYEKNFTELWEGGQVEGTGKYDLGAVSVPGAQGPVRTQVLFSPGRGRRMSHEIASRIAHAQHRIRICSPVITSGVILGTLADIAHGRAPDFKGVYDRTQMEEVLGQWAVDPHAGWKGPAFKMVSSALPFASKVTTPYSPTSVHDYMHAKVVVVDNTVFTGSYNLSHAGEDNAENVLQLDSPSLADEFAAFVDRVFAHYGALVTAAK
jgi:phosphatidylserine/phosphatidylglycerophosphate/cardiolipin synthase-like enzyme